MVSACSTSDADHRVTLWGPAPNRHLEPMLAALDERGSLQNAYYAGERLWWTQLGTRPDSRPQECVVPKTGMRSRVRELVRGASGVHLMVSFANTLCFEAMARCARERVPYFVLAESFTPRRSVRGLVRDCVYRYLLRRVAGVFALSSACARDFMRVGVPRERIYPGMYPGPSSGREYDEGDTKRVVFVGRVVHTKGLDLLVRAVGELLRKGQAVRLEIVGTGDALGAIRASAQALGVEIVEHGSVSSERVREILTHAGALVVPTRFWEGWGYVVNEAIACGVPVVASDVVAARELIVGGRTGAVFRSEDVDDLSRALSTVLRLHGESSFLRQSVAVAQTAIDPRRFLEYMLAVMETCASGSFACVPAPWLAAARELGGNEESDWWSSWDNERVVRSGRSGFGVAID
jgi:glycosyltransferase involved in cell wall biosynthesis